MSTALRTINKALLVRGAAYGAGSTRNLPRGIRSLSARQQPANAIFRAGVRFKSTMKAAVMETKGKLELKDVPIPKPNRHQFLAKVLACGVCHTDLHAIDQDWPVKPTAKIPGHEVVARVTEVGDSVSSVKVGDIVGVPWLGSACGHCEFCLAGQETVCPSLKNAGYSMDGGFAEYIVGDPDFAALLPDDIDPIEVAPILCAGITTYKALKSTNARPGEWVVVTGLGGLGQLAVQYAKAMGLNVIGVDVRDSVLQKVKDQHGADYVVNAKTEDPVAFVKSKLPHGVQAAVVTAVTPSAFGQALDFLRPFGTAVLVGLPEGNFPLSIFNTVLNGITVRGSIVGTRIDMIEALRFFQRGQVKSDVVTDKLENIVDVFQRLRDGKVEGRVVIDFR